MASGTIDNQQLRHFPQASGAAPTVIVSIVAIEMKAPSTIIRSETMPKRKLHIQALPVSGTNLPANAKIWEKHITRYNLRILSLTYSDQHYEQTQVVSKGVKAYLPLGSDDLIDFLIDLFTLRMNQASGDEHNPESGQEGGDRSHHKLF
jgi:hypothetical protein